MNYLVPSQKIVMNFNLPGSFHKYETRAKQEDIIAAQKAGKDSLEAALFLADDHEKVRDNIIAFLTEVVARKSQEPDDVGAFARGMFMLQAWELQYGSSQLAVIVVINDQAFII